MFNFREDVVDLSVKNAPKVARRLRLIGDPYMFWEFTDKVYVPNPTNDPALRGKTIKKEFPDGRIEFVAMYAKFDEKNCFFALYQNQEWGP
jgi:hypothetical protein